MQCEVKYSIRVSKMQCIHNFNLWKFGRKFGEIYQLPRQWPSKPTDWKWDFTARPLVWPLNVCHTYVIILICSLALTTYYKNPKPPRKCILTPYGRCMKIQQETDLGISQKVLARNLVITVQSKAFFALNVSRAPHCAFCWRFNMILSKLVILTPPPLS